MGPKTMRLNPEVPEPSNIGQKVLNFLGGFKVDPKAIAKPDESIPGYMGRRIREAAVDAVAPMNTAINSAVHVARDFTTNLLGNTSAAAPVATATKPNASTIATYASDPNTNTTTVTRPEGTAVMRYDTGQEAIDTLPQRPDGQRVSEWTPLMTSGQPGQGTRAGTLSSRSADIAARISPENPYGDNIVAGPVRTNQVRGGALTDAEAARNLVSRAEQDAAAKRMAASFDRSTAALKDLRETRMQMNGEGPSDLVSIGQEGGGFGSDVLDRDRYLRQFQAPPGASNKSRLTAQDNLADAQQAWDQGRKPTAVPQAASGNPLDLQRFLLQQQQANSQQEANRNRLTLTETNANNKNALEQSKVDNEARSAFIKDFSLGEGAPNEELGAAAWQMSQATKGLVPPEVVKGYMQRSGVNWKDGPPKDMKAYNENIMAQLTKDYNLK